jgi:molybdopterin adenylyltransferase
LARISDVSQEVCVPVKTGLLCVPTYDEAAVDAVRRLLAAHVPGFFLVQEQRASMQRNLIEDILCRWCDEEELDLVVTIGGTLPAPGPGAREIVPDATLSVAERHLPGLPETMRAAAQDELPLAIIDRSVAAVRGRTLLLNLPAGAAPAELFLGAIADVLGAVVAHLQEDPAAPQLADGLVPDDSGGESDAQGPAAPAKRGLNADDFAAFLKRRE